MNRSSAAAWVLSCCAAYLRLSQAKTLSELAAAAMRCQRVSLANLGRAMLGSAKHQIKRVWRFCANDRIEAADAMRGVVRKLLKKRNKPLVVSVDWTEIRGFSLLMASVTLKSGRSVPLCWGSCTRNVFEGHRSRNAFEESLLLVLLSLIPPGQKLILLADRGFGRTELGRFCQKWKLGYVIRITPGVWVQTPGFSGKLLDYPLYKGICKRLSSVSYRKKDPLVQHVVVRWVRGLAKKHDEPWFLMSNLELGPAKLSRLYARRMGIEELFRDAKSKRNGWSLRDTQIGTPERLERLVLILALAYWLLCAMGLWARKHCRQSLWSSSTKATHSVFQIGQILLERLRCTASAAWEQLRLATEVPL